jgi:hypothetical protein
VRGFHQVWGWGRCGEVERARGDKCTAPHRLRACQAWGSAHRAGRHPSPLTHTHTHNTHTRLGPLEDEPVSLVAQVGDEVVDQLVRLCEGPEVLAPHMEGLLGEGSKERGGQGAQARSEEGVVCCRRPGRCSNSWTVQAVPIRIPWHLSSLNGCTASAQCATAETPRPPSQHPPGRTGRCTSRCRW